MPIDPATGKIIIEGAIAATQAITRGGPRRQYKWNKRAAADANQMNRDNAIWSLEENKRIQNEQRVYDSPESQMARYKAAGLNPHLIYGSGSSAGSAFPISAPGIAPSRIDAPSASYPDIAGSFLQAGQSLAGTQLAEQKAVESEHKTALIDVQVDIAKSNPMLNPHVYRATIFSMEALAHQKAQEARYMTEFTDAQRTRAEQKIQLDIQKMLQEIGLRGTDQELKDMDKKIKNEILQSKEYENALKKLQVDWMQNGEVTPQHIFQGLMLLLTKMM